MSELISILSEAELDFISGGDKPPKHPKPPKHHKAPKTLIIIEGNVGVLNAGNNFGVQVGAGDDITTVNVG
ncbi:hypothetical protein [Roseicella aerolata]|uniref:Uncharacterized protein n=1 Tax=Roseicella aerolata TaxID=2883479 RepID=A0A9X1IFX5_9PROT|nr:hypothetical protein [Roseicella aerolata]MCB4822963.1 hypothetical protein [Roseicella aerolata]